MPRKPPRFLPTLGLIALWLALYFVWIAVRPEPVVVARQPARPASSTTTTVPALFKIKP
jgi:hypothetical protein